jgi:hypothetical protein
VNIMLYLYVMGCTSMQYYYVASSASVFLLQKRSPLLAFDTEIPTAFLFQLFFFYAIKAFHTFLTRP